MEMAMHLQLQNLHPNAVIGDIRKFFAKTNVDMEKALVRMVGGVNGDAFITFKTDEEVLTASTLTGSCLLGQPLKIFPVSQVKMDSIIDVMFSDIAKSSLHALGHDFEDKKHSETEVNKPDAPWMNRANIDIKQQNLSNSQEEQKEDKREKHSHEEIHGTVGHSGDSILKGLTVTVSLCDKDNSERSVRSKEKTSSSKLRRERDRKDTDRCVRSRSREGSSGRSLSPKRRKGGHYTSKRHRSRERSEYSEDDRSRGREGDDRYWIGRTSERGFSSSGRRNSHRIPIDGLFRQKECSPEDRGGTDRYWMFGERECSFSPEDKGSHDRAQDDGLFRPREKSCSSGDRRKRSQERDSDNSFRSRERDRSPEYRRTRERSRSPKHQRSQDTRARRHRFSMSDQESENEILSDPGFVVVHNVGITVTARDLREFFNYQIANRGIIMKSADQELQHLTAYVKFVWLKDAVKCLGTGTLHGSEVQTDLISPEEFEQETADINTPSTDVTKVTQDTNTEEATRSYPYSASQHPDRYGSSRVTHASVIPIVQYQTNPYEQTCDYSSNIRPQPLERSYQNYHSEQVGQNSKDLYSSAEISTQSIANPYHQSHVYASNIPPPFLQVSTQGTDNEQRLSQTVLSPMNSCPITSMSKAFASEGSSKRQYYIGLWNIPSGTTAYGVWKLYGALKGGSLGVIFGWIPEYLNTDSLRTTAFVIFENLTDCDQAMSTYRCCMKYNEEEVDNFFESICSNDACKISISTLHNIDRVLSQEERALLVKSKEMSSLITPPKAIDNDNEAKRPESTTPHTLLTVDLLEQAFARTRRVTTPLIIDTKKDRQHTLTDLTLNSAWKGQIYLILGNLGFEVSACSLWEMYGGLNGQYQSTGVILSRTRNYHPTFAYVGFMDVAKCSEAMKIHKKCAKISLYSIVSKLSILPPPEVIMVSTESGEDYMVTPEERIAMRQSILKSKPNSGGKFWVDIPGEEAADILSEFHTYVQKQKLQPKSMLQSNKIVQRHGHPILNWVSKDPLQSDDNRPHIQSKAATVTTAATSSKATIKATSKASVAATASTAIISSATTKSTTIKPVTFTSESTATVTTAKSMLSMPAPVHVVDTTEDFKPIQQLPNKGMKKIKVNLKRK